MAKKVEPRISFPLSEPFEIIVPFLGHFSKRTYREGYGYHTGLDYIGNEKNRGLGRDILSIADGMVVNSSPTLSLRGYGHLVVIHYPQFNIWARYAHLETRSVKENARVQAGQPIGTLGTSGTDNVHLHFDMPRTVMPGNNWRYFPHSDKKSQNGFTRDEVLRLFLDPVHFFEKWLEND